MRTLSSVARMSAGVPLMVVTPANVATLAAPIAVQLSEAPAGNPEIATEEIASEPSVSISP